MSFAPPGKALEGGKAGLWVRSLALQAPVPPEPLCCPRAGAVAAVGRLQPHWAGHGSLRGQQLNHHTLRCCALLFKATLLDGHSNSGRRQPHPLAQILRLREIHTVASRPDGDSELPPLPGRLLTLPRGSCSHSSLAGKWQSQDFNSDRIWGSEVCIRLFVGKWAVF